MARWLSETEIQRKKQRTHRSEDRMRESYYSHSSRKDTSSEHHLWFSPGGYNWLANNNNNASLWKGKPLPG